MHYNRKDIIQAWYCALSENCYSDIVYQRMQKIITKHGLIFFKTNMLTINGLAICKKVCKDLLLNRSYF